MYKLSLSGVQNLTEDFAIDLESELKKARPLIQEIFKKSTFALPDDQKIDSNITVFLDRVLDLYFDKYETNIGFSKVLTKLWPGSREGEILLKKVGEMSPCSITKVVEFHRLNQ